MLVLNVDGEVVRSNGKVQYDLEKLMAMNQLHKTGVIIRNPWPTDEELAKLWAFAKSFAAYVLGDT